METSLRLLDYVTIVTITRHAAFVYLHGLYIDQVLQTLVVSSLYSNTTVILYFILPLLYI